MVFLFYISAIKKQEGPCFAKESPKNLVDSPKNLVYRFKHEEKSMSSKRNTSNNGRLLTEVELELMNIVWSLEKATVKEILSHLPKERDLAYTTVATVMKILEQKEFLICHKDNFAHTFSPLVSKASYEGTCIEHMLSNVFDGEPVALVQRLLDAKTLRKDEILAIEEALKTLSKTRRKKK
jgi:predicted transcriptional regulator